MVARGAAQELQAKQVHGASGEFAMAVEVGVHVGEIHGEKRVVFADGGAKEARAGKDGGFRRGTDQSARCPAPRCPRSD